MLWPDHCVQGTHGSELENGVRSKLESIDEGKVFYIRKVRVVGFLYIRSSALQQY